MPSEANDGGAQSPSKDRKSESDGKSKRSGRNNRNRPAASAPRQKFEGMCEGLKCNIYDCADICKSDLFAKTTKAISTYVGQTYKSGKDISNAVDSLELPTMTRPPKPDPNTASAGDIKYWEKQLDAFVKRKEQRLSDIGQLYSLVWGQCTEMMKQKVEAMPDYSKGAREKDGIELLKIIRSLCFSYQSQQYTFLLLVESIYWLTRLRQGKDMTVQVYYERFKNTVEVV